MRKKIVTALMIMALISMILVVTPKQTRAVRFALAVDYPDNPYGQGIYFVAVYENSTGSWVWVSPNVYPENDTIVFTWDAGIGVRLWVFTWLNNSIVGADDIDDGVYYQRHNITVTDIHDTYVWGQQNFTYSGINDDSNDPMFYYRFDVVLGFLPEAGETYTLTIGYQIWW